jgi:hypothetical protein
MPTKFRCNTHKPPLTTFEFAGIGNRLPPNRTLDVCFHDDSQLKKTTATATGNLATLSPTRA